MRPHLLSFFLLFPALAQSPPQFKFVPLVTDQTPVPNSTEFFNPYIETGFSIDENYVAFVNSPPVGDPTYGVWLYNLSNSSFTQLVKIGGAAPGTGGLTFTNFGIYCVVKGLHVMFLGYTGTSEIPGIYSVPVTGGTVSVIANQNTVLPGVDQAGNLNASYCPQCVFSADDQYVVFPALSTAGAQLGVFLAGLTGSNLTEIAGQNENVNPVGACSPASINSFAEPRVYNKNAVLTGANDAGLYEVFVTGLKGLPTGPLCSPYNNIVYSPVASGASALPGDVYVNLYTQTGIDNKFAYFTANNDDIFNFVDSLWQVNFDGSGLTNLLLGTNPLPGLPGNWRINNFAAQFQDLIFTANGAAMTALFTYQKGAATRIIGSGDAVFGGYSNGNPVFLGENGLSNQKVVFGWSDTANAGIVLAEPAVCATNVTTDFSVTQGPIKLNPTTGQYDQPVTVTNIGTATVNGPVSLVLYGLTTYNQVFLAQPSGLTGCTGLAPIGSPYKVLNSAQSIAPGEVVTVHLAFTNPGGLTFGYSPSVFSGAER